MMPTPLKPALLLVDLQNDFLDSAGLSPAREPLIAQTAALLQACRAKNIPVIHIWTTVRREEDRRLPHWKKSNRWLCVAGTPGHATPTPLQPLAHETVVHKSGFNGFAGGQLDTALKQLNCDTLIIAGVHLHTCVRTAAAEAMERGLQVFMSEETVASNDPVYAAATRRWLTERDVEFAVTSEILSRIAGHPATSKLTHRSPRETSTILFELPIATPADIAAATLRAQNAQATWRLTDVVARCQLLGKVATRLEASAKDLGVQMALELGKPLAHGADEVRRAADNIRDVIRRAAVFEFQKRSPAGTVRHEPLGVVALISPWNNPVAIPVGKIAPALVYGNTVVWKPSPPATKIAAFLVKVLRECGLPADAVQLLDGDHATAQRLAADECVNAVTITGSNRAGHAIHEICARRFLPLQAELSGNNAAIVWDDADLPAAAKQIAWGAFGFAGQRCTANRRAIVSSAKHDDFLRELKLAAEKMHWGDPLEPATDIGPMVSAGRRDEHAAFVATAQASGPACRVEPLFAARAREPWVSAGANAQPVIVCCDDPAHPLVLEETMCPLLVVQRANDFTHALKLCNGVRHGLVAALFTHSPELKNQFLAEAQAGMLKFNTSTAGADVSLPFGGWKMSGLGPPEHGEADSLFYTKLQAVYG